MADWLNGKDFKIVAGPYCSIRDAAAMAKEGVTMLVFRNTGEVGHQFFVTTDDPTAIKE